jgi:DNA-binding MarR family transcriptional regulator
MTVDMELARAIRARIARFVNKYAKLERIPYDFGTGPLYLAEVNVLEAVGEGRALTGRGLSAELGITKGAVSQIVKKLVGKGLLKAEKDSRDGKEIPLSLTAAGRKAFRNHERFHEMMEGRMLKEAPFSREQVAAFVEVLAFLEERLEPYKEAKIEWR